MDTHAVIPRSTLTQMVAAFRQSSEEITQAFAAIKQAEARLQNAFGTGTGSYEFDVASILKNKHVDFDAPASLQEHLKRGAWRILVERMEIRRVLSIKRSEELDKQLQSGIGLPDIDEVQILAMVDGIFNSVGLFIEEAVKEVFDYLRPRNSTYKTNKKYEVGAKVILTSAVQHKYSGGFQIHSFRQDQIRAIDNVFHALDGKGSVKSYCGPLADAISKASTGETDYFRYRCFNNLNLHLEFKRLDLLEKFNAVAGGMRLKPAA